MKRLMPAFIIILIAVLCIGVILMVNFALGLTYQAKELFGPPAKIHGVFNQYRYSIELLMLKDSLTSPTNPSAISKQFEILPGRSASIVVEELFQADLIHNPDALRIYMVYSGIDTRLQSGIFKLSASMTPVEIAQTIQNPDAAEISIRVFPGWRIEEIAEALPASGIKIDPNEFIILARKNPTEQYPNLRLPAHASHEGFLFPNVYTIPRSTTPITLISIMLESFSTEITPDIISGISKQGLSLYEGVTLASIIERETRVNSESAKIASVFLNRLNSGISLQADPTVQYAVAESHNWWKNPLTIADLETVSPYNTYVVPGLPPGPIANPGIDAIRAVANPESTNYYFFRAACDGSGQHLFSTTYQEHQENACP